MDLRRYDRWAVDAVHLAGTLDCDVIAISDSLLSPFAVPAAAAFAVVAGGAGPFDSHVGTLALGNALVTACAGRLRGRRRIGWTGSRRCGTGPKALE